MSQITEGTRPRVAGSRSSSQEPRRQTDRFASPPDDYSRTSGPASQQGYGHLEDSIQPQGYYPDPSVDSRDMSMRMFSELDHQSLNSNEWVDVAKSQDTPPESMGDYSYLHDIMPSYKDTQSGELSVGDSLKRDKSPAREASLQKEVPELIKPFKVKDEAAVVKDWLDVLGNGDIMKKVLKAGMGIDSRPDRGQLITVNMTGCLENGAKVECYSNFQFTLGDADVIQGLDLAIPLMELGEKCEIVIQPRFAYGQLGRSPDIPPDAVLKYTIELLQVDSEQEIATLELDERMRIGAMKREKGNFWYGRGDYSHSVLSYRRALDYLDDEDQNFSAPPEILQKLLESKIKVYNNMAAAQLKLDAFDAASKSVDTVLRVQPNNVKAIYRKAKILSNQGNINDAILYMKKALSLEPETKVIQQDLCRLIERKKTESHFEREMYRRMLGGDKTKNESGKKKKKAFTMWGTFFGGVAAVLVGIFVFRQYHTGW